MIQFSKGSNPSDIKCCTNSNSSDNLDYVNYETFPIVDGVYNPPINHEKTHNFPQSLITNTDDINSYDTIMTKESFSDMHELQDWIVENKIPNEQIDKLMQIIYRSSLNPPKSTKISLPFTSKSFLDTTSFNTLHEATELKAEIPTKLKEHILSYPDQLVDVDDIVCTKLDPVDMKMLSDHHNQLNQFLKMKTSHLPVQLNPEIKETAIHPPEQKEQIISADTSSKNFENLLPICTLDKFRNINEKIRDNVSFRMKFDDFLQSQIKFDKSLKVMISQTLKLLFDNELLNEFAYKKRNAITKDKLILKTTALCKIFTNAIIIKRANNGVSVTTTIEIDKELGFYLRKRKKRNYDYVKHIKKAEIIDNIKIQDTVINPLPLPEPTKLLLPIGEDDSTLSSLKEYISNWEEILD